MMEEQIQMKYPFWGPFLMDIMIPDKKIKDLLKRGDSVRNSKEDFKKTLPADWEHSFYYEYNAFLAEHPYKCVVPGEHDVYTWFKKTFGIYFDAYIQELNKTWGVELTTKEWKLESLWINYMKARDFNPPHNHSGDLSFVIYLQVPNELKKEFEKETERTDSGPGAIIFTNGNDEALSLTNRHYFPMTGQMFIFPAWLKHYVVGYRSEVERISVSGNIHFNTT